MGSIRRSRTRAVAPAAASAVPPVARAAAPIDQSTWADRKAAVTLPNGLTLRYVALGEADGPPVVLLHGWPDSSRSWSLVAPYLPGLRLFALDQRGHGQSDRPECCYTLVDMAYDVKLFLDAQGIERASIVGHSLGSMVGQVFAANHPGRIDKLVLIGSTVQPPTTRGDWLWSEVHRLQAPIDPHGEFLTIWQSSPNPVDPVFLEYALADSASVPIHVWRGVLREFLSSEFGRLAPDITAPTLILWGDQDPLFGEAHQQALRNALPAAGFRRFEGLGHNLLWEGPAEVGVTLAAFLGP